MVCYLWFQFTNDQDVVWQTKMDLYKVARHSRKTKVLREWVQWRRGATWGAVLVAHGYIPLFVWCSVCSCCFVFCFLVRDSLIFTFSLFTALPDFSLCVRACMKTHVSRNCFGVGKINFPPPVTPPLLTLLYPPTQVDARWKQHPKLRTLPVQVREREKLVDGRASGRIVHILSLTVCDWILRNTLR